MSLSFFYRICTAGLSRTAQMVCIGSVTGRQRILMGTRAIPVAVTPKWGGFARQNPRITCITGRPLMGRPLMGLTSLRSAPQKPADLPSPFVTLASVVFCIRFSSYWQGSLTRSTNCRVFRWLSCLLWRRLRGGLVSLSQLDSAAHRPGSGGDKVHPAA